MWRTGGIVLLLRDDGAAILSSSAAATRDRRRVAKPETPRIADALITECLTGNCESGQNVCLRCGCSETPKGKLFNNIQPISVGV